MPRVELDTIQIPLGNREHTFSYPKAESEMIHSVLNGEDYPLEETRVECDAPVILDVGSNCGAAAIFFKNNHLGARVICFEPSATTFALLEKNTSEIEGIECHPFGLWDKEGTFQLHQAPNSHSGAATLRPSAAWPSDAPSEEIVTKKLSSELSRLGLEKIHILKIDAETVEADILHEVLTNAPEIEIENIFVEYHGIAIRKYLTEELSARYDVHLCNVLSDRQGTLLFVLRK